MRKRHLFVAVTIIMAALVFNVCDLIAPVECPDDEQDTIENLVINGKDAKDKDVIITFSRPVQTAQTTQKAVVQLIPQNGDAYEIKYDGQVVSSGSITVSGTTILFSPANGNIPFTGTYGGGKVLSFPPDGIIPGTPIAGFKLNNGSNGGNSEAYAIARAWGTNATAVGNIVYVNGDITVLNDITISNSVTLVFNARDNNPFTIGTANTNTNTRVTVKGGIVVSEGRGVTLKGSSGTLVVEGEESSGSASTINGKLIVYDGATLDIAGDVTILKGGLLALEGHKTAENVAYFKYKHLYPPYYTGREDANFKLRGKMSVENGGRLQMPDPYQFDVKYITGVIEVKPGGELILVTSDPKGNYDLHPLIGVLSTATQGAPVGADFVMTPSDTNSKIVIRISGGNVPALELSGNATALGRLILDDNHGIYDEDDRKPPYRFEVWLTYPFTVTASGFLAIGNSEAVNLRTTVLVTGEDFSSIEDTSGSSLTGPSTADTDSTSTGRIYGIKRGINKGVLTNNNRIQITNKNAIVQWFGGYFNSIYGKVFDSNSDNIPAFYPHNFTGSTDFPIDPASVSTYLTFKPFDNFIEYKLWSPEWKNGPPTDANAWFPWNGTGSTATGYTGP